MGVKTMTYFIIIYLVIGFLFGILSVLSTIKNYKWSNLDVFIMFLNTILAWPTMLLWILTNKKS